LKNRLFPYLFVAKKECQTEGTNAAVIVISTHHSIHVCSPVNST